jgi:hypothetical protein
LYLKGGNALPFLDLASGNASPLPYNFTGDFDCSSLVNPDFDPDTFRILREILIVEILNVLKSIVLRYELWAKILYAMFAYNVEFELLNSKKITLHQEALTPDDMNLYEHVYAKDFASWKLPDGCPMQIEIHPNLPFKHASQNMTVISLRLRTIPPIDLIDISIPAHNNKYLQFEWDIHGGIPYINDEVHLAFFVSNFVNTYIDYRVSALLDTRKEKRAKRTQRADRLRNTILNPLLRSGTLKMHTITRLKSKTYAPELGIHLDEILGNLSKS